MVCETVTTGKPVEEITMLFVPGVCSNEDADGFRAIVPDEVVYAEAGNAAPPTVMEAIAPRHVAFSVKVKLTELSTVAPEAALTVGAVPVAEGVILAHVVPTRIPSILSEGAIVLPPPCLSKMPFKEIGSVTVVVVAVVVADGSVDTPSDGLTNNETPSSVVETVLNVYFNTIK